MLNLCAISTHSLGRPVYQLCLICSRGPWKCETAPPGRAVLTARWFVRCVNAVMSNTQTGETGKGTGWRGEKMHLRPLLLILLLLAPRPHTVSFAGQFTLKGVFTVSSVSLPGPNRTPHPPSKTDNGPPPHMHGPSKAGRPLFCEATHEININLTFDHVPRAPK